MPWILIFTALKWDAGLIKNTVSTISNFYCRQPQEQALFKLLFVFKINCQDERETLAFDSANGKKGDLTVIIIVKPNPSMRYGYGVKVPESLLNDNMLCGQRNRLMTGDTGDGGIGHI